MSKFDSLPADSCLLEAYEGTFDYFKNKLDSLTQDLENNSMQCDLTDALEFDNIPEI